MTRHERTVRLGVHEPAVGEPLDAGRQQPRPGIVGVRRVEEHDVERASLGGEEGSRITDMGLQGRGPELSAGRGEGYALSGT